MLGTHTHTALCVVLTDALKDNIHFTALHCKQTDQYCYGRVNCSSAGMLINPPTWISPCDGHILQVNGADYAYELCSYYCWLTFNWNFINLLPLCPIYRFFLIDGLKIRNQKKKHIMFWGKWDQLWASQHEILGASVKLASCIWKVPTFCWHGFLL